MPSSGMLCRVVIIRADVSQKRITSVFRVARVPVAEVLTAWDVCSPVPLLRRRGRTQYGPSLGFGSWPADNLEPWPKETRRLTAT
jgi:hypothetical protein